MAEQTSRSGEADDRKDRLSVDGQGVSGDGASSSSLV